MTQVLALAAFISVLLLLAWWLRIEGITLLKAAPILAGTALLAALLTGLLPPKAIRNAIHLPGRR